MRPLKKQISITIDGDVLDKLRTLSEDCDRSLSQYINIVLKNHIKDLEEKGGGTYFSETKDNKTLGK